MNHPARPGRSSLEWLLLGAARMRGWPGVLAGIILVAAAITSGCSSSSTTLATPTGADSVKCPVSLATPLNVDAGGGTARLSITTQPECGWNVSSAVNWIFELSAASGQGNGDVEFRVAPNDGFSARDGEIVVNDSRVRSHNAHPAATTSGLRIKA